MSRAKSIYDQRRALLVEIQKLNLELTQVRENRPHDYLDKDQYPPPPKAAVPGMFGRILSARLAESHAAQRHCRPTCATCKLLREHGQRLAVVSEQYRELGKTIIAAAHTRASKSGKNASIRRAQREGHEDRNKKILAMHTAGKSNQQIKDSLGLNLSVQRISQIIIKLKV